MTEQGATHALAALMLTGLGVTVPLPAFVGGTMIALGMCFAVMLIRPLSARRGVPATLLMGVLAALFAAMLHDTGKAVWLWGGLPIQAQMGAAGALSQGLFELLVKRSHGLLAKLADRAGLPGDEE